MWLFGRHVFYPKHYIRIWKIIFMNEDMFLYEINNENMVSFAKNLTEYVA